MLSKSDNIEIMISDEADELCSFIVCHIIIFNSSGSCIDSLYWIKIKKVTIYPINKKRE